LKRQCTVFHVPRRFGRSHPFAPDRSTHVHLFTNGLLSDPDRPGSIALPGSNGAILAHGAQSSSYPLDAIMRSALNLDVDPA
jgi:hypothetical protein